MTRDDYHRIRDEVYKNAGMDKFDFDLMMFRVVDKAVQEEREACARAAEDVVPRHTECGNKIAAAIRARDRNDKR